MRLLVVSLVPEACRAIAFQADAMANASKFRGSADQRFHVKALVDGNDCKGGWNAINPSFVPRPDTPEVLVVAMRGLCLQKPGKHARWYSKMVVGSIPLSDIRAEKREKFHWKTLAIAPDLRRPSTTRHECYIPDLDDAVGPEDPRLISTDAGLFAIVTGYEIMDSDGANAPVCGEHGMLLYAAKVTSLAPPAFSKPVKLTFDGMGKIEKNWAMFTPSGLKGGHVLAVYSVHPHKIANVNLLDGNVNFIASTYSSAVTSLATQMNIDPENFHGGAGAARSNKGYFLSVLHTGVRRADGSIEYWNFPYRFSTSHPYEILRIGKKLPLTTNRNPVYSEHVAFVTTVMLDNDDVFIGYGSGDSSSRTFRMPLSQFDNQFFPHTDIAEEIDPEDLDILGGNYAPDASSECIPGCRDAMSVSICRSCLQGA